MLGHAPIGEPQRARGDEREPLKVETRKHQPLIKMMNTDVEWVGYQPICAYFSVSLRSVENTQWWE